MGKIIFILGGARSGKSSYAVKIAKGIGKKVAFIATCEPKDPEMKNRIALHRNDRPVYWKTFEEPEIPRLLLRKISLEFDVIVIDCLTFMISNLMLKSEKETVIERKISSMLDVLKKAGAQSVIIANEVGLGIVPANKLARDFRDIAGRMNQIVAGKADEVFFLISGIPWRIKCKK